MSHIAALNKELAMHNVKAKNVTLTRMIASGAISLRYLHGILTDTSYPDGRERVPCGSMDPTTASLLLTDAQQEAKVLSKK